MIRAEDLRVGNLVSWNPKLAHPETTLPAMEIEVRSISEDKIAYFFPNIEHRVEPFEDDVVQEGTRFKPLAELEPVPLTDEVLLRAAFKMNDNNNWTSADEQLIVEGHVVKDRKGVSQQIEGLHQLQNIYYKTTGQELEIDHS